MSKSRTSATFSNISRAGTPWVAGAITIASGASDYMATTNFGFVIPLNAKIIGVMATYALSLNNSNALNDVTKLVIAGALAGNNNGMGVGPLAPGNQFGSAKDKWGLALTPAIVNADNFGIAVGVNGGPSVITVTGVTLVVSFIDSNHIQHSKSRHLARF